MSSLSLDGGSRIVGTEFIKLEITGTSNLATQNYVNDQIIQGAIGDTYTQAQIDGFLANKADTSYVVGNFYTQTQVDTSLTSKANQSTTYTKTEVDTSLTSRANQATTYTKTEVDTAVGAKANSADVYAKTEIDTNNYTKTQVDTALALKANQATTYTKTENDTALALKANQATTYTKTEVDTAVNDKVSLSGTDQTMTGKLTATTFSANTFNSNGASDITFQRNSVEYCKLGEDGTVRLLEFPTNGGVSANRLYGNYFMNRSLGWDTIFEGSNVAGDGRTEYMRYDFTNEVIQLPKKMLVNGGDGKTEIYENVEATNYVFRIWNKETTHTPVIHIGAGATSNDMVLSSSGFTFNKAVSCAVGFSVADNLTLTYNKKILWGTNSIVETSSPTVPITRFDAPNSNSAYYFFVGNPVNDAYRIFTISNTEVLSKRVFKCKNIDTENNTDLVFKRNGNEYMRLDQSEDEVVVSKKLRLAGGEGKMVIWENTESTSNVVRLEQRTNNNSNFRLRSRC